MLASKPEQLLSHSSWCCAEAAYQALAFATCLYSFAVISRPISSLACRTNQLHLQLLHLLVSISLSFPAALLTLDKKQHFINYTHRMHDAAAVSWISTWLEHYPTSILCCVAVQRILEFSDRYSLLPCNTRYTSGFLNLTICSDVSVKIFLRSSSFSVPGTVQSVSARLLTVLENCKYWSAIYVLAFCSQFWLSSHNRWMFCPTFPKSALHSYF